MGVDNYIQRVIRRGDEGSGLLRSRTASTLKNNEYVEVIEGKAGVLPVLRIPEEYIVVVHSTTGDPAETNSREHARTLVSRLVSQAKKICAIPLGFSNIVDSKTGELELLSSISESLVEESNKYGLAILNGENAILGERVRADANISGTMISIVNKKDYNQDVIVIKTGDAYSFFDPEGKAVYINSDGVGTKLEFYERSGRWALAFQDFFAMVLDDCVKIGAVAKTVSAVSEFNSNVGYFVDYLVHADQLSSEIGFLFTNQYSNAGFRVRGYGEQKPAYNIGGSAVSVIDESRLDNPLIPRENDVIIAIKRKQNPRSNGITDKRKVMVDLFGEDWHNTREGALFLEYLATPSTIFYPVFKDLIKKGLASSVFHMSGGAFKGKLARPLAEHGYFVTLEGLFEPDWREYTIVGRRFTNAETAYAKWPMGNEGFVTTDDPTTVLSLLRDCYAYEGRVVGVVERAKNGRTGVVLKGIKGSNGKDVYFSGRNL